MAAAVRLKHEALAVSVLVELAASMPNLVRRHLVVPPPVDVEAWATQHAEPRRHAATLPVAFDAVPDLDALDLRLHDGGEPEEEQEESEHTHGAGGSRVCRWSTCGSGAPGGAGREGKAGRRCSVG